MNISNRLLLASAAIALSALTGCPNPNTYGTPRTIPPGKVQIVASLEGVGLSEKSSPQTPGYSLYSPTLPSLGVRIGVADSVDLGIRLAELSSVEFDGKLNFLRTRVFDMAIDPGVQGAYVRLNGDSFGLLYFNLPLLLGVNFSHALTLVLTPGFTELLIVGSGGGGGSVSILTEIPSVSSSAPLARLGVGLNIRIGDRLAMQPEVTALRGFDSEEPTYWNFGLGFVIGTSKNSNPDYRDVP